MKIAFGDGGPIAPGWYFDVFADKRFPRFCFGQDSAIFCCRSSGKLAVSSCR